MVTSRQVPVAIREPDQTRGWLRGIRVSGFGVVMMGLLILAVVVLAPTMRVYIAQQQHIADLSAAVEAKKAAVGDLESERARWDDPSYIRAQARARLYYVMPGEISYLVIDDRSAAKSTKDHAPISQDIQRTKTNWLDTLFDAAMTAGLSTKPPAKG